MSIPAPHPSGFPPAATGHERIMHEHSLASFDGRELFYRAWHPGYVRSKALILFHGGHEHSGRFQDLVERLDLADVSVFAWDARGHGRSPGARGHARHFHDLVRDADCFVRHVSATYGIRVEDMMVLGHSVGSVIIGAWLHDYAPGVRGAVLGSPAFDVRLYAPLALPALRLWRRLNPDAFVNSYVRPGMLTHDRAEAEARRRDPLIAPPIAVRVLTSLYDTAARIIDDAGAITTPVLLLSAGSDWVVHKAAQRRFFERLGSRDRAMHVLPGFYHEIFHERDRHIPIGLAREFILRQFGAPRVTLPNAPVARHGEAEYQRLLQPLAALDPCRLYYAGLRAGLKTVGRLSAGVRLGWASGFDSGRTLDYVYRNGARGFTPLGRIIDRAYLDSAGWRGIRERGANLQSLLMQAVQRQRRRHGAVHVVDLASGPGRYVLESLRRLDDRHVSATCRDRDTAGLAEGRRLAAAYGLRGVDFEPGDAFDARSIRSLRQRPNVAVVSGLYELFSDNQLIGRSLAAIHEVLVDGGYLIYTNQPYHPQQALIARTLVNRDGQPWVMRLRSQAEMNALVRRAGFEPREMLIDDAGIFSVTLAVKRSQP
ncbi:MAG TPA: bifunctional alpha/beta hydrolase/class I SAM-dependent methyltransferase [Acidiferrobacterales bacterium]